MTNKATYTKKLTDPYITGNVGLRLVQLLNRCNILTLVVIQKKSPTAISLAVDLNI